jgi:hypothetical protein
MRKQVPAAKSATRRIIRRIIWVVGVFLWFWLASGLVHANFFVRVLHLSYPDPGIDPVGFLIAGALWFPVFLWPLVKKRT